MKKQYILKKVFQSLITIFFVIIFNYFLFRIMPGDPLSMLMRNPKASPEAIARTKELFGLGQPWYTQFFIYLKNLLTGDFGLSFLYKKPVLDIIMQKIIPTVVMVGLAEIVAITVGILLGVISAWKRGTKIDVIALSFSLITYSMPTFWLGIILISIFSVSLRLFPTTGMFTPGKTFSNVFSMIKDGGAHLFLPVLSLSLVLIGCLLYTSPSPRD